MKVNEKWVKIYLEKDLSFYLDILTYATFNYTVESHEKYYGVSRFRYIQ